MRSRTFSIVSTAALICILLNTGCSVPNLESPNCSSGRETVKKLYSYHFGSEMSVAPEAIREREKYLTSSLVDSLRSAVEGKRDYFTAAEDQPKAFRVGVCTVNSDTTVTLQVILLWRDDRGSRQQEVQVEVKEIAGKWLINKVF